MSVKRLPVFTIIAALAMLALAAGCARQRSDTRPMISVSVEPQRFLLEKLAGDRININVLLPKGTDPEAFDPTVATLRNLEQSDLYIPVGSFPFEEMLERHILTEQPDIHVVRTDGLTILNGHHCAAHHDHASDHGECHDEDCDHHEAGAADPHIWTSVRNLRAMAAQMHTTLIAIDPEGREEYDRRYAELTGELDSLDAHLSHTLAPLRGQSFLIWHPSLSYFANDYGLTQIAVQAEGKEPTPAHLTAMMTDFKHYNTPLIVVNEVEHNPQLMSALNADLALPELSVSLMNGDLFNTLITISDALRSAYNP